MNISIVTIVLNGEKTIARTIESVLRQTVVPFEYIIVDGRSSDKTLEIAESYKRQFEEKGILYTVYSEKDNGISDAFNKGLNYYTGDAIAYLNADDWYQDDTVETALNGLANDVAFVYGNIYMHVADGDKKELISKQYTPFKAKYTMPVMHPTVFMKRTAVDYVGDFNEKYMRAMDYDFVLRSINGGYGGKYIDSLFVNMQDGGAHKVDYKKTLKEVRDISVSHGGNRFIAWLMMKYTYFRNK